MVEFILSEKQIEVIKNNIEFNNKLRMAQENWVILSEEEKKLVLSLVEINSKSDAKLLQEKWYNTVMDVLGLVDPTPIVDTINAISYFSQGETLFGVLTLIAAVPGYVGDAATKPVIGALKIGGNSAKELNSAMKLIETSIKTGNNTKKLEAVAKLTKLAEEPGVIGKFLKSSESWGPKVINWIDKLPAGPFKGLKNTIKDYFVLLTNAGKKSANFQKRIKVLLNQPTSQEIKRSIPFVQKYLKNTRIFKTSDITKPGFFSQVFFGGIPRLFRSSEGRGVKILMGKTKFWLGFLDYMGIGNFIGPEDLSKKLGGDESMARYMEQYQKTPKARKYYDEDFGGDISQQEVAPSEPSAENTSDGGEDSPIKSMISSLFTGQLRKTAFMGL
jgi:hypothetical protein